jgi:predicted nucleic acid-binding protein
MAGRVIPASLLLDASALSKLALSAPAMQPWLAVVAAQQAVMFTSAAVLAECVDGSRRDAEVHRVVNTELTCRAVTDSIGYEAGRLRAAAAHARRKPRDLTIDAIVVATACALERPVVILTSDTNDIDLVLAATPMRTAGIRSRRV